MLKKHIALLAIPCILQLDRDKSFAAPAFVRPVYYTAISCSLYKDEICRGPSHYGDVIIGAIGSRITSLMIVYSTIIQVLIKENIKAPRHSFLAFVRGNHRSLKKDK